MDYDGQLSSHNAEGLAICWFLLHVNGAGMAFRSISLLSIAAALI